MFSAANEDKGRSRTETHRGLDVNKAGLMAEAAENMISCAKAVRAANLWEDDARLSRPNY